MKVYVLVTVALIAVTVSPVAEIRIESFQDLSPWREVVLDADGASSTYEARGDGDYLLVSSENGASMLIYDQPFNVYQTPILEWRWQALAAVLGSDLRTQDGDDSAIRIYVSFRTPLNERGLAGRAWARLQQRLYGDIPPDSALSFVWAPEVPAERSFPSPFTDALTNTVPESVAPEGQWSAHRVNVLERYRRHFGEDPPTEAYVAVFGDSDNTGNRSAALLDYIRILRE
ncbi:MAG TPA: DUF3047 domain-containing protein [Alkalispirochaeta sp.]|nr:DUF3047 domain-containing protein [Alkalispirochaeta sp.]